MSRDLYASDPKGESDFEDALASNHVRPVFFVKAEFDNSTIRLCTSSEDILIDGETFTGSGDFLSIGMIEETHELRNSGVAITLNGLNTSFVTYALVTDYQNRFLTIRMGLYSTLNNAFNNQVLYASGELPPIIFKGRMEVMKITDTGDSCALTVSVQNKLADFERKNESRYTDENQKNRHPADFSLEHVQIIQKRVLEWGA